MDIGLVLLSLFVIIILLLVFFIVEIHKYRKDTKELTNIIHKTNLGIKHGTMAKDNTTSYDN